MKFASHPIAVVVAQEASLACKGSGLWQYLLISLIGNIIAGSCQHRKDPENPEKPNVASACCGYMITLCLGIWGMVEVYALAQPSRGPACAALKATRLWDVSAVCAWLQVASSLLPCAVACCLAATARQETLQRKHLALTAIRKASRMHGAFPLLQRALRAHTVSCVLISTILHTRSQATDRSAA